MAKTNSGLGVVALVVVAAICGLCGLCRSASNRNNSPRSYERPSPTESPSNSREVGLVSPAPSPRGRRSRIPSSSTDSNDRVYMTGPRGGCYYINSGGNKTYVDRSLCSEAADITPKVRPLASSGSSSSSRSSGGGRVYIRGPRGGCYYINGNGNKTYVDHSFCGG